MSTATQTKRYDRGYEDAIEGRKPRATDQFYLKGYAWASSYAKDLRAIYNEEERVS